MDAPPGFDDVPVDVPSFKESTTRRKGELAPEFLRKILRDRGDMTDKRFKDQRKLYIGAIRFLPHAILKLLENVPMPWESERKVNVIYHTTGALTIVTDTPNVCEPLFKTQWAAMWSAMRKEKKDRESFIRVTNMTFGDEETPLDYAEHLADLEIPKAIHLELDEEEDKEVVNWLFNARSAPGAAQDLDWLDIDEGEETQENVAKGHWMLHPQTLATLQRLADPLLVEQKSLQNSLHLWDDKSFFAAKAMNVALPGGPKFQAPIRGSGNEMKRTDEGDDGALFGEVTGLCNEAERSDGDDDWTEFNDLGKVIVRHPFVTETQLAFPHLYSQRVRGVGLAPYRAPTEIVSSMHDDANCSAFHINAKFNPIIDVSVGNPSQRNNAKEVEEALANDLDMPALTPFWDEVSMPSDDEIRQGLNLFTQPNGFTSLRGGMTRPQDVCLIDQWYRSRCPEEHPIKVKKSYQRLLKQHVKKELRIAKDRRIARRQAVREAYATGSAMPSPRKRFRKKNRGPPRMRRRDVDAGAELTDGARLLDKLAETKFFQRTNIEWIEAAQQLVRQGHTMLRLLLLFRNHRYVNIDYNFNAKPVKILTTKERKKSRLGSSFHLVRELLKLVKVIVDLHVKHRLQQIDAYQLADALQYTLNHVDKVTGIYRYKYGINRQIKECKDIKHVVYYRFNTGGVKKGPGTGFWEPSWRVWVHFMRGMTPLLERYLANMLGRLFEGRRYRGEAKRVTKQRLESDFDINLKEALKQRLREMLPEGIKLGDKARRLEGHANEAFKCWKANIPWKVQGLAPEYERLILRFVQEKADWYVKQAHYNRERICKGEVVDKGLYLKNLGRLTRLKLKDEMERQQAYLSEGPYIEPEEASAIVQMMRQWLQSRNFQIIDFPRQGHNCEKDILNNTLNRLRQQHNIGNRLTLDEREEQKRIEEAFDAPQEALNNLREHLAKQRIFKSVEVQFMDNYTQLVPVYKIHSSEKMTDAFLDSYLWFEASRRNLFPTWIKPSDTEPPQKLVYHWCNGINNSPGIWNTEDGDCVVAVQATLENFYDNIDWKLMRSLLNLIMHPELVNYICARHDVRLEYKDMSHDHSFGLIRGFQFSGFVAQYWGLVVDLLLIGTERASQLAGPAMRPNPLFRFSQPQHATCHPLRAYLRYNDQVYLLLRYSRTEAADLIERHHSALRQEVSMDALGGDFVTSVAGFKNKKCWPRDCRMRLYKCDVDLARAAVWDYRNRLPLSIADFGAQDQKAFMSVYSANNPNLLFDMSGFEVRILPLCRTVGDLPESESMWTLRDDRNHEVTARAYLQVTAEHVERIENKIRRALLTIGNATFERIAQKWNLVITEVVPYYREAILGTEGLQEIFVKGETRMQTRVKMALNSKMPSRFPPVVFYSPPDIGGLGMLSIGGSLIPARDLRGKETEVAAQYFVKGLDHRAANATEGDVQLPNVLRCFPSWEREFLDSDRAWAEFRHREAESTNRKLSYDELEDLLDQGIPRIRTFFSKERRLLEFDKGWRIRQEFSQFAFGRYIKDWWFHKDHDGRLCQGLDEYRKTMIQALGGIETIIEHTLFHGTGLASWEGLFWNKTGSFEESKKHAKLTKAQRQGLTQVPNRRFALWWSPTINRSSVYTGFEAQVELTGIKMTGKLEMIKVAFIALFSNHLWEKIHALVVTDLHSLFSLPDRMEHLGITETQIQQVHAKKSFTLTTSQPDIVLLASNSWVVGTTSNIEDGVSHAVERTRKYWIDVQLRWGDYDRHDIAVYAREKFSEFRVNFQRYPSTTGIVLAIDLSYNRYSAYGYWIPGMKEMIAQAMGKIMKSNPALFTLRERIKKALQLYTSDPTEAHLTTTNMGELFSDQTTWMVDDTHVFVTSSQATAEGNRKHRAENGALLICNPRTGQLLVSVIHKSVYLGQKRRSKLGREKGAEEVATWLRSLPIEERPHKIISCRSTFMPTLNNTLLDFPNIVLGRSDLHLPLQFLMKHDRLGDMVFSATESKAVRFNLFDDWGMLNSSATCFNRLILILRCYHVNLQRAKEILWPDRRTLTEPHHFWPTLTQEEWALVERQLHDAIIVDFAMRHKITETQLTKREMVDIILGKEITAVEIQHEEMKELERKTKTDLITEQTTTTVNKHGEEITVKSSKTFETGAFESRTEWRERALALSAIPKTRQLYGYSDATTATAASEIKLPQSLVETLVRISDVRIAVGGFLLAKSSELSVVRGLLIPPQLGAVDNVKTPPLLPAIPDDLVAVGWIRTQTGDPKINRTDLALLGRVMQKDAAQAGDFTVVSVGLRTTECVVMVHRVRPEGIDWCLENATAHNVVAQPPSPNHVEIAKCSLGKEPGFVLVPQGGWNYFFKGPQEWQLDENGQYAAFVDIPKEFYHASHRPQHFSAFSRGTGNAGDVAEVDENF